MTDKKYFESPYIIWTMRRTGGTSFMAFLSKMSKFISVQHEPFNNDRVFGYIAERFVKGFNVEQELEKILSKNINIKHCYEIIPMELNKFIYDISSRLGYKHIFLYRDDQVGRVLSLEVSMLTNVWGPNQAHRYDDFINGDKVLDKLNIKRMKKRLISDNSKTNEIKNIVEANHVSFEKLYFNLPSKQFEKTESIMSYLGFNGEYDKKIVGEIIDCFYSGETPSSNIKKMINNYDIARDELKLYYENIKRTSDR